MKKRRDLKLLALFLFLLIVLTVVIFVRADYPMHKAKKEATAIAKEQAGIQEVTDFYWFTRKDTYFTVVGLTEKGEGLIVIIPREGGQTEILKQSEGVTEKEAIQSVLDDKTSNEIKKITLGLVDDEPVWEIVAESKEYGINYYLVSFRTGDIIHTLHNV